MKKGFGGSHDKTHTYIMLTTLRSGSGGYRPVVITGTVLSILASIAFAYLRNYELLVLSRVPQGLADAMMLVGGK